MIGAGKTLVLSRYNRRFDKIADHNNRPTKAGFVWVENPKVKNGGFWRKAPKGGSVVSAPEQNVRKQQEHGKSKKGKGLDKSAKAAIIAGAAILGVPAAAYAATVGRYRHNLDAAAKEAMAEAEKFEVPDTAKAGMRFSTIAKEEDGRRDLIPKNAKEADQITLVVNGFGGTGGRAGDYFAGQLMRQFKDHHLVGVENPEFDVKKTEDGDPNEPSSVDLTKERLKTALTNVLGRGKNPVAIRMAAQAYAYHKKTGKPINLVGYSAGGMVTNEAMELLKRMGVEEDAVKVANMGSPHYGLVPMSKNALHFTSDNDPATKLPGFKTKNRVAVNSVEAHLDYFVAEKPEFQYNPRIKQFIPTGKMTKKVNTEVIDKMKQHFDRGATKADSLPSPAYILGYTEQLAKRFDKKQPNQRKGDQVWVEDRQVKGGGYWRKLPKGASVKNDPLPALPNKKNKLASS